MTARQVVAALIVVLAALALAFNTWVGAQGRAFLALSTTIETPLLTWTVRALTREPDARETIVARMPTTVVAPGGDGPWPAVVFANGATRAGRKHEDVQRLARGLARAGYLVYVPDLPGLRSGEITQRTVDALVAVADAAARASQSRGDRVGFTGVSVGASLALLAAEDERLRGRVSAIAGIAPYARLKQVVKLGTTEAGPTGRYDVDAYLALAVARSLTAALSPSEERDALRAQLESVDDDDPAPLSLLARVRPRNPDTRALVRLLRNRDPSRFEELYARLPAGMRRGIAALSPIHRARRVEAPVELASARTDIYFPLAESRLLVRALPRAHLTPTSTLDHAIPRPTPRDLRDLLAFDAWVVRSLRELR